MDFLEDIHQGAGCTVTTSILHGAQTRGPLKAMLIGSPPIVNRAIQILHSRGIAEVCEWSRPVAAGSLGKPGDVVSILVRQVSTG